MALAGDTHACAVCIAERAAAGDIVAQDQLNAESKPAGSKPVESQTDPGQTD